MKAEVILHYQSPRLNLNALPRGREEKYGLINPKGESLLFQTSISPLKPFTLKECVECLYMNGLLSCWRPLNSSLAVSWGPSWWYEWDVESCKTHSRLRVQLSSACSSQQKRERAPSTSLWAVSFYLGNVFVPLRWLYLFIAKYASGVWLTGRHVKTHVKLAVSGLLTLR